MFSLDDPEVCSPYRRPRRRINPREGNTNHPAAGPGRAQATAHAQMHCRRTPRVAFFREPEKLAEERTLCFVNKLGRGLAPVTPPRAHEYAAGAVAP